MRCVKVEKSEDMLVYVTGQIRGQTLILILGKVPTTFTGQKLDRKIGLIFLYFFINLVFFGGRNEFLPSFAASEPQLKLFCRCGAH